MPSTNDASAGALDTAAPNRPSNSEATREVSVRLFIDAETSSLELLHRIEECVRQILEVSVLRNLDEGTALTSQIEAITRMPLTSDEAEGRAPRATSSSVFL